MVVNFGYDSLIEGSFVAAVDKYAIVESAVLQIAMEVCSADTGSISSELPADIELEDGNSRQAGGMQHHCKI